MPTVIDTLYATHPTDEDLKILLDVLSQSKESTVSTILRTAYAHDRRWSFIVRNLDFSKDTRNEIFETCLARREYLKDEMGSKVLLENSTLTARHWFAILDTSLNANYPYFKRLYPALKAHPANDWGLVHYLSPQTLAALVPVLLSDPSSPLVAPRARSGLYGLVMPATLSSLLSSPYWSPEDTQAHVTLLLEKGLDATPMEDLVNVLAQHKDALNSVTVAKIAHYVGTNHPTLRSRIPSLLSTAPNAPQAHTP